MHDVAEHEVDTPVAEHDVAEHEHEKAHLRVGMLCPYSLSRPGGVQGQVVALARALRAQGHETVVVGPTDGPVDAPGLPAGAIVGVGRSFAVPANGSVAPVALGPLAPVRAVRVARRRRFDVLHLHEPLAPGPGYGWLLASSVPKVGTFHRAGDSVAYHLLGPLARAAAGRLRVRCAVSDDAAATAARALGGSYEVVGNGVEIDRWASAAPWVTDGPTLLFIGRHEPRKGLDVLLDAFARWRVRTGSSTRAATLWIAGEGPRSEELRRRYPPDGQVHWLGRIGEEEKAARLRAAHVLCAPSLHGESFGMILVEAMAARTTVVASDIPGYAAVVGRHGVLVPPGDAEAWAAALRTVLDDAVTGSGPCDPRALDAAFAHASRWSMARLAQRYADLYARAVGTLR